MSLAIGMDDPEFLLNRGTERREVAIAEYEVPPVAVPLPMLDLEPSVVPGVGAS